MKQNYLRSYLMKQSFKYAFPFSVSRANEYCAVFYIDLGLKTTTTTK